MLLLLGSFTITVELFNFILLLKYSILYMEHLSYVNVEDRVS